MKTLLAAAVALSLLAPAAARAQDPASIATFHASLLDTLKLKITRIETESRLVTLKGASGDTLQVVCGPEIVNFDQLRVGDQVNAAYKEDLSIRIDPTGSFSESTEKTESRAKKGGTPGAQFWEKHEVSAKISSVNKEAGYAVIETRSGEKFEVIPDVPENLDKVQAGNFVVVTQTITRAISVTKPGKATTKKTSTKTTTTTKTETK